MISVKYKFIIPEGVTATIILPDGTTRKECSGEIVL